MLTLCQVLTTTPHPCEKGFTHPMSEEESGLPQAAQLHGGQGSLCPALWGLQTGRHTASSGCCPKLPEPEWLATAGIYSLTVLEAESLKSSRAGLPPGKTPPLTFPSSGGSRHSGHVAVPLWLPPAFSSVRLCYFPLLSFKNTCDGI